MPFSWLIPAGLSIASSIFGGGGGGGGTSPLSNFLSGQITSQRIPGQTTAGEYTPPAGGFGTYNYIPTGATQLDPQLISAIMGGMNNAGGAMSMDPTKMSPLDASSYGALQNFIMNNPGAAAYTQGMNSAGTAMQGAGQYALDAGNFMAPQLNNMVGQWGSLVNGMLSNPYTQSAVNNAGAIGQQMGQAGQNIGDVGQSILNQQGGLSSLYASLIPQIMNNPFNNMGLSGAQQAGAMGSQAGQNAFNQGAMFSGQAAANLPAAQQILNMGFDPQQQLYDKSANQLQNQLGSYLANTGLTGSGAGAGIVSDALNNFNMNWQNNQLGRALSGLQGYNQGMQGIGSSLTTGAGLQQGGAQSVAQGSALPGQTYAGQTGTTLGQLGQLGGGYQTGAGLASTGANLVGSGLNTQAAGNTYGADTFNNLYQPIQSALSAATSGLGNLSNTYGNTIGQMGTGAGMIGAGASMPYNAFNTIGNSQLSGINSYLNNVAGGQNLNNNGINNIGNYLKMVMQGSQIAGNNAAGAQGAQVGQNANAAAGLSPLINGGLGWLSSLFSGGGGSSIFSNPSLFSW